MEFDVPVGKLNKVSTKSFKRPLPISEHSADASLRGKINQAMEQSQEKKQSIFLENGTYVARVLRVEKTPNVVDPEGFLSYMSEGSSSKKKKSAIGKFKFVRIKATIPEMHAHLPTPREGNTADPNYPDHYIIDEYPTFTARSDDLIMDNVFPGASVIVDFSEKDELTGEPIFVTPIVTYETQTRARMAQDIAGQFNRPGCPPANVGTTGQPLTHGSTIKNHQGLESLRARARQTNMKGFVFGDSQSWAMGAAMSKYLENVVGLSMVRASGATGKWRKIGKRKVLGKGAISLAAMTGIRSKSDGYWPILKRHLKQVGEGVVCIVGGRNGEPSQDQLASALKKIMSAAPNAKIVWVTPPGKVPAYKKLAYIVKKPVYPSPNSGPPYKPIPLEQRTSHMKLRKRVVAAAAQFPNKVLHIDTYPIMPSYVANGSKNKKGDGLHLTYSDAPELLNGLKALVGAMGSAPATRIKPANTQKKVANANAGSTPSSKGSTTGPRITSIPTPNCQPMGSMGQYGSGPLSPNSSGLVHGGTRAQAFPSSLSQIDLNKVMPGLVEKWKGNSSRVGFDKCFNTGMSPTKHVNYYKWTVLAMAAAEVIERYWRTWNPSAKVNISDHWRGFSGGSNGNHKGPAIDHEIVYNGGAIPSIYQWCSIRYLQGSGRLPIGGLGLYMNFNGAKSRNNMYPVGITGPGLNEQGRNTKRTLKAPGGSTNVHYDYRGFADFKMGKGKSVATPGSVKGDIWWRASTSGSGKDDLHKTHQTVNYLRHNHPKGKQILNLLNSWKTGNFGNNPPGFNFVQVGEYVPSWSQVLGLEPWVGNQRSTS